MRFAFKSAMLRRVGPRRAGVDDEGRWRFPAYLRLQLFARPLPTHVACHEVLKDLGAEPHKHPASNAAGGQQVGAHLHETDSTADDSGNDRQAQHYRDSFCVGSCEVGLHPGTEQHDCNHNGG